MDKINYFVGIGAQKAGTTWLGDYFLRHPQVCFSPIKELHYFDSIYRNDLCSAFDGIMQTELVNLVTSLKSNPSTQQLERIRCLVLRLEMTHDKNRYKHYFEILTSKGHKAFGEITPSYSLLKQDGFLAIRNMYSQAKFLFILRDPVDRYWSQLRFRETLHGTEQYSAQKLAIEALYDPQTMLRSNYKRTLIELYKVVPKKDVCIAFYEHLMDLEYHEKELKSITDFLAVDYIPGNLLGKINSSKSVHLSSSKSQIIASHLSDTYRYIFSEHPHRVPRRWKKSFALCKQ